MAIGDMTGRIALVTGGAGGIGTGISKRLAEAGARGRDRGAKDIV